MGCTYPEIFFYCRTNFKISSFTHDLDKKHPPPQKKPPKIYYQELTCNHTPKLKKQQQNKQNTPTPLPPIKSNNAKYRRKIRNSICFASPKYKTNKTIHSASLLRDNSSLNRTKRAAVRKASRFVQRHIDQPYSDLLKELH